MGHIYLQLFPVSELYNTLVPCPPAFIACSEQSVWEAGTRLIRVNTAQGGWKLIIEISCKFVQNLMSPVESWNELGYTE